MFLTVNGVQGMVGSLGKCTPLHAPGPRCPRAGGRRCGPWTRENQMMLKTAWYPFEDLRSAQEELSERQLDSLFAHALGRHGQWQRTAMANAPAWAPALDISERKDAYLVTVELPGVKLDDLTITLPALVVADAVEASVEDGVLQILVPKAEEAKPKRIQVLLGSRREAIEAAQPTS